jgi:hypothetical protein
LRRFELRLGVLEAAIGKRLVAVVREPERVAMNLPFVQISAMEQPAKSTRTFVGPLLAVAILVVVFWWDRLGRCVELNRRLCTAG